MEGFVEGDKSSRGIWGNCGGLAVLFRHFFRLRSRFQFVASLFFRKSFSRLCVRQTSVHSAFILTMPRSENCRKPRQCLICPKTGSMIALRLEYSLPSLFQCAAAGFHLLLRAQIFRRPAFRSLRNVFVVLQPARRNIRLVDPFILLQAAVTFASLK